MALKLRSLGGPLALVVFSTLVGIVTAEVAVRVWAGVVLRSSGPGLDEALKRSADTSPDSKASATSLRGLVRASTSLDLVYELKPDLDCRFKGVQVRTNSHGMRNQACTLDKPDGVLRIAGLGDSVMFGWGVGEEDTFLRVLERRLAFVVSDGRKIDVLNFAVPGYNSAMEVAAFREKVLDFSPDLVILNFVHNDFDLPRFMIEAPDLWSLRRWWIVALVRDGLRSVRENNERWHEPRKLEALSPEHRDRVRQRFGNLAGPEAFGAAMISLEEITSARAIPVVFVLLQTDGEPYAAAYEAANRHAFYVVTVGSYFTDYVRDHGVPPTREGWADAFWLSPRDPHPNELGHRLFAEAIFQTVTPIVTKQLFDGAAKNPGPP